MGMVTYMYDPADSFRFGDEAFRGVHLVTVQLHWQILDPLPDVMPKDTKHKPKCHRCRNIIRDEYSWLISKHGYCRTCGDKEIASHCLCDCEPYPYPKGVTEKDLRAFRSRTGIELPDDVKKWLKITG